MKTHRPTSQPRRIRRRAPDTVVAHGEAREAAAAQSVEPLRDPAAPAPLRTAAIARAQGALGNAAVARELVWRETTPTIQRKKRKGKGSGANPGGAGPGSVQHAAEQPYTVSGATLDDLKDQLGRFGGFAAESNAPIGLPGRVAPQRQPDGTFKVQVRWVINGATVKLPQWENYDTACPAAQVEWDRYLQQARLHEQQAHIDAARNFVAQLGEEDTLITGATVAELTQNLKAKQQDLADRLQAIHDSCTHGADIDAMLHPDRGRC